VKFLLWGVLILAVVAWQGSDYNFLEIHGIRPDLVLIVVYGVALIQGEFRGTLAGLGLGLVMDLTSVGPFYQNFVMKGLVGFIGGFLGRWLLHAGPFLHLWVLFGVSFLQGTAVSLMLGWINGASPLPDLRDIVLPQALYDAILGSLVLHLLLFRREREIKVSWTGDRV
jgi:rod shape-determining protein MreD